MSLVLRICTILIGLSVGALATLIMPKRDLSSVISKIVLGIGGAITMDLLGHGLGWYREGGPLSFLASFAGAVILLMLYRVRASRQVA